MAQYISNNRFLSKAVLGTILAPLVFAALFTVANLTAVITALF